MSETTDRIIVVQNGKTYHHVIEGVLFRKKTFNDEETGKEVVIYDALREHEVKACVRGIFHGEESREYNYTLVRRTVGEQWLYYPLPLVFDSMARRVQQGFKSGTQVPCGRWVRRTRGRVHEFLEPYKQ
ncbi:hypothetical protein D3C81_193220 [compost metagenome]